METVAHTERGAKNPPHNVTSPKMEKTLKTKVTEGGW
jgi:hypothetical protein